MSVASHIERGPAILVAGLLALVLAGIFIPLGIVGLADPDEGMYLLPARLVMEGKLLYHDFHYPQMPMIPYLYAGWMTLTGVSWYSGRLLSSLLAVVIGLVFYHHALRVTGRRTWALVAVALLVANGLTFSWYPLVKTYAVATLALFAAYSVLELGGERWKLAASGVLLGLAIDTRLYVAALVPVFALAALRERARVRQLLRFGAGLALALLPNLYFAVIDPANFVFNILGHHAVRSNAGLVGDFAQKGEILLNLLGINRGFDSTSLQFTLVFVVWAWFVLSTVARRERVPCSVPVAIVLIVASLVPTPVYSQYFCIALPFLVLDVVRFVARLDAAVVPHPAIRVRLRHAGAALIALYVLVTPFALYQFAVDEVGVLPYDASRVEERRNARNWSIPAINRVARGIDAAMPPAATTAISWWPGYFVETRARILPRLENPFAMWYATRMARPQIARFGFMHPSELVAHIRHHDTPVVVLGNRLLGTRPYFRQLLLTSGYVVVDRVNETEIYRFDGPGAGR